MANRKAGWYWVKYADRLVSFGATKEWVPLYWQGERFEDEHYFLEHQNIGEIGQRIPEPDEPWQCVPVEPTDKMRLRALSVDDFESGGTSVDEFNSDIYLAMLSAAPKPEDAR